MMAYDEGLAVRIREALRNRAEVTEKKMFGGVAFLLGGKMFCGIANQDLMVRVGSSRYEASLNEAHVRPMDFTGRPMRGYVFVGPNATRDDSGLRIWLERGAAFVATLDAEPRPDRRIARGGGASRRPRQK